jgi:rare lipoprotein A
MGEIEKIRGPFDHLVRIFSAAPLSAKHVGIGIFAIAALPISCPAIASPGQAPIVSPSFAAAFEMLGAPLPVTGPPEGAVDISTIEPEQGPHVIKSLGIGTASYYGKRFHGRRTANGERFDMNAMTAAHKTLPFGTHVRVTNPRNGRSVTVRINDRGPFIRGRQIDLSRAAAQKLGMIRKGHARVQMEIVAP